MVGLNVMDGSTGGNIKGCPVCNYEGYVYYETGVVCESTGIAEVAIEPCDCYFGEESNE